MRAPFLHQPSTNSLIAPASGASAFTDGSVLFASPTGQITEDPTNFKYDNTNNQILLGNGTAANPSYSLISSTGTGLFRGGTNILAVSTAGVQRAQVDATGQVQVGTTAAQAAWINLGGSATHPDTTSATQIYGFRFDWIGTTTATSQVNGIAGKVRSATAAYTLTEANGFRALTPTVGAGSAITTTHGLIVDDQGGAGITNAYGVRIAPQTGATSNFSLRVDASATQTLWVSGNADNTTAAAGIAFGSSRDTVLYRSVASGLRTDGKFAVGSTATLNNNERLAVSVNSGYTGGAGTQVIGAHLNAGTSNVATSAQTGDLSYMLVGSATITAASASTIPDLTGLRVHGPIPSTNVTATRSQAVLVQTGADANIGLRIRANSATQTGALLSLHSSTPAALLDFTPVSGDAQAINMVITGTTGLKIGTATSQKIGFYNAAPVAQPAGVADATGGAIIDIEGRAAINALISRLESTGIIATV